MTGYLDVMGGGTTYLDSADIFNNIIYNPSYNPANPIKGAIAFKNQEGTPTNVYEDYNMLYGRTDSIYYVWSGTGYHPTSWRAATLTGLLAGHGANTTVGDPLFVNAGTHDYTLQAGSPAASGGRGGSWPTYRGAYAPGAGLAPVAAFVGTPTSGVVPLTITFTDQSSSNPTSWAWTFGDAGTSTSQHPSHQYMSSGTYTVTLTATNAYGNDDETKTDYIIVGGNQRPVLAAIGEKSGREWQALGFRISASEDHNC
jgi:PKD repeat protein